MGKDVVKKEGVVEKALPGTTFRVKCDDGASVLAHLAGKMRVHRIRIIEGDRVTLELPDEKSERGRIVFRN